MPELPPVDVGAANRFISSLSKSLQALCHGCMDFDNGIEIVGYINVNIDCGSKVDYVLNEKVLKSTTNSMTFVSNSFYAKKEQPKQTTDGSCSPIPELNIQQPPFSHFQGRPRGYQPNPSTPRPGHFSSHSRVLRGSQKRAWTDNERDWRFSQRKHARPQQYSAYQAQSSHSSSFSESTQSHSQPAASLPSSNSNFMPTPSADSSTNPSDVNVKQEPLESENQNTTDQTSETTDNTANDGGEEGKSDIPSANDISIKTDPDAQTTDVAEEGGGGDGEEKAQTDFTSSFLDPSNSGNGASAKKEDESAPAEDTPAADDSMLSFNMEGSAENEGQEGYDSNYAEEGNLGMDSEYAGSGEGSYQQQSYTGEGSSGASQFEVIEIDDEDEDVQAMFNDPSQHGLTQGPMRSAQPHWAPHLVQIPPRQAFRLGPWVEGPGPSARADGFSCNICGCPQPTLALLKEHLVRVHGQKLPFSCSLCGKGFMSYSGYKHHMAGHEGRKFHCHLCDSKFVLKHHLKEHLKRIHKVL